MPCEFICPLKEHTPTLNAVFFREIEVVLARPAVAVHVICQSPLHQCLDNLRVLIRKDIPTTTHCPDFNAASTAFKHFALVLSVSWLTCSYPTGSKYCLSKCGAGTRGVEVGQRVGLTVWSVSGRYRHECKEGIKGYIRPTGREMKMDESR